MEHGRHGVVALAEQAAGGHQAADHAELVAGRDEGLGAHAVGLLPRRGDQLEVAAWPGQVAVGREIAGPVVQPRQVGAVVAGLRHPAVATRWGGGGGGGGGGASSPPPPPLLSSSCLLPACLPACCLLLAVDGRPPA